MSAIELNHALFNSRLKKLLDAWKSATANNEYNAIAEADAIFLAAGDLAADDEPIRKGTSLQIWLLGYEFPSTLTLFQKDKVSILCSASKARILSQIKEQDSVVPVELFIQAKGKAVPSEALIQFSEMFLSKKRVGTFTKEPHSGALMTEWSKRISDAATKPDLVDISHAVSGFMAVKDAEELKIMRTASNLTSTLLVHHIAVKLETILDRETKISHEAFAAQIEMRLGSGEGESAKGPDMRVWGKGRGLNNVDWSSTEFCYSPIIHSQNTKSGYDLKSTAESSKDDMAHKGVFLVSVGIRYKGYCSNVGRTFIVDPSKEQEAIYNLLLSLQAQLLKVIKDGVTAREVYQEAISYVKEKNPVIEQHFVKNVGFGMGLEFRDSAYLLSLKNAREVKAGMIFNLVLGFSELIDESGKKYALQLVDTIAVERDKSVLLTEGTKSPQDTLFFLSGEIKPAKKPPVVPLANLNGSPAKHKTAAGKVLRTKTRSAAQQEVLQSTVAKIAEHQKELHSALQTEGLAKYSEAGDGNANKEGKSWKRFQSYKGEAGLPPQAEHLRIYVDRKAQTVILPIHGFAVPFHINTVKNASKNDEGEFTYLRINFQTPGQLAGKKEDTPFEDPEATFIRSITYRSPDGHRFDAVAKQITDLKKEVNKREQQKKEMADVIEQDVLQEVKGRRPVKLPEVFVRPALDGKRLPGEVEIHQNGLRYQSPMGSQKIDVLFSNVKHFFFQPCDKELLVVVHLHLKSPIMIGKKKAHDIQFYREASDVQFDETGNRKRKHRYGDEDEIEMEQMERKRRQTLNKEFKNFADKVAEAALVATGDTLEVDIPFRELSFEGVPFRTNVRLQPTTECLVHLIDPPFLVVTLSEIEVASLERVQFHLKQFDMVLVFKDFTKPPLHINSITSTQLDDVKNWLDSVDIPLSEGPVNLNWGPIMKTINEDPNAFFLQGGWSFLGGPGTGEESEGSLASSSESEFEADSNESPGSSDDHSEYGDSNASEDESGSDFGAGSATDEEGDDWDELERKAAKSDLKKAEGGKKRDSDDSDSDSRPKKGKGSSKANGKTKGKR